jgi:hypothetical protein
VLAVVALAGGYWALEQYALYGTDTIEYRGERIKLSKHYDSYDAYKDDPNNIHPSQNARVQKLVMEAPIRDSYPNYPELMKGTVEIEFPGYGLSTFEGKLSDGTALKGVSIEIPRANKDRYLIFRQHRAGHFEKVEDFVGEGDVLISNMYEEDGWYVFVAYADNKERFRRPVTRR